MTPGEAPQTESALTGGEVRVTAEPDSTAGGSLRLEEAEAEVLAADTAAFARALSDPAARARFQRLASAAAAGDVPSDLVPAVETMLGLLFERGCPSNRAVLQAIFGKTPR